ncbi:MAG: MBL fold metallo-hydrolase [Selenomonadaceae bacterium]|nr:MBL fold metallo-hydrolase [Selenomonadaceae bacterium]
MNRRNFIKNFLIGAGALTATAGGGIFYYVNRPEFGRLPQGERLKKILNSPNYYGDHFDYFTPIQVMAEDFEEPENRFTATLKFLFGDKSHLLPHKKLPTVKTNLKDLPENLDCAVWMGHSTIYLQLAGKKILLDPVFSSYASPIFFVNKAFEGSNIFSAEDFPEIDILAITHDHWDHLDYPTVMALKSKVKKIICPLGVGEHFELWNFDLKNVIEEDWDSEIDFGDLKVFILPNQHFSGRFLKRNPTEWCSFAFVTPQRKIFCSGDGGYGEHFKMIGEKFGNFDCAFMENGQYNMAWHLIHCLPNETAQAAEDIRAKKIVPIHAGKFALARHAWNDPYKDLTAASVGKNYRLLTPRIGELIDFSSEQNFSDWFS